MLKMFVSIFALSLLLFSAGCAKYWYQEGKSFNECKRAHADCFAELSKRTDFSSPTLDYEIKYMKECMQANGYQEVSAGELPLNVRREEPETSLYWRARGIAGTVEP